ncbi:MAG TPA: PA2169 family four-helix-bundle protein [Burkholderiaceae bacterium]|nr:PA2169 family four-helix-bundle protein [Burkholderiaceae bacterium]
MDTKDTIDVLNTLLETSIDGERGFRKVAEHVHASDMQTLFTNRANECRQAAAELRAQVVQLGGEPDTGGTASGALHRGWLALLGSISGHSDKSLLEACERGEDSALERYRDALDQPLPDDVRMLVERQYEGVKRNHAQVRALRDQARAANV